jgi:hypothetical protein
MPSYSCLKTFLGLLAVTAGLSACAGSMPVPGGSADINQTCFTSIADMQARLLSMPPGMPEGQVFNKLCRKRESLTRIERREIRIALLGGDNVLFSGMDADADSRLIQSLYGYKLAYKNLSRVHGFTSPVRIRTDETGYDYTVTLIFREGRLFAKPILTGGVVNNVTSGTIFDYVTPGTLLNAGMASTP